MKRIASAAILTISVMAFSVTAFAQSIPAKPANGDAAVSKKGLRRANWNTEKSVRKALSSNKQLDSSNITVVARGDKVTLNGNVPSSDQIKVAQDVAQNAASGKTIVNNLILREEGH
jgi:osmotically-inducible protein OsmY